MHFNYKFVCFRTITRAIQVNIYLTFLLMRDLLKELQHKTYKIIQNFVCAGVFVCMCRQREGSR
jgi:hypothetical protein